MQPGTEKTAIQMSLAQLQRDSFKNIVFLSAVVGWIWLSWSMWPQDSHRLFRSQAWMTSALLLVVALVSFVIQRWKPFLAIHAFICGLTVVITGSLFIFKSANVCYLYVIPIIFSSVLFSQIGLLLSAVAISAVAVITGLVVPNVHTADLIIPLMVIGLTSVAILISTDNLQTALAWALNGYQQAHKNELIARERKTKLERVLKNLDTTMVNLERANIMLDQMRQQAEEARRLKQQFAQTISHELRTPLNLIVGFTETMIKSPEYYGEPLAPAYLRDLSVVYRNACHLQNLVNDVLDLARLESAYMSLESEELDISHVIEDAINTARGLVEGRGLAIQTDLVPDMPTVWGDAVRLKQVLLNLLNNAARFTESGSVTVHAGVQGEEVIVSVSDTGIGIPAESRALIFESFQQLENPMQRRNEGAGLGLAISKQLINLHGGRIWVESEVGVGSRFFFSLPVRRVETIDIDQPLNTKSVEHRRRDRIVLIVTRSPSTAALLSRLLPDYHTVMVPDLKQAIIAAQQVIPQAIILDTGSDHFQETSLRAFVEALQLPQAAIITCPLPGEEPLRKRFDVDGYLIKPVSRDDLWDMMRQFSADLDKVLVVDDDRDFVHLIGRMLAGPVRQYHVMYAYSGREALEMIKRNRPEIMLLDLNLSDIDGFEVIHVIRSDPRFRDIHIVVLTASEEIDSSNLLDGSVSITKAGGLPPGEILKWIQSLLDNVTMHSNGYH
jgi:signal transduction histidine kinase/DNA-binding response OmpR family regulator